MRFVLLGLTVATAMVRGDVIFSSSCSVGGQTTLDLASCSVISGTNNAIVGDKFSLSDNFITDMVNVSVGVHTQGTSVSAVEETKGTVYSPGAAWLIYSFSYSGDKVTSGVGTFGDIQISCNTLGCSSPSSSVGLVKTVPIVVGSDGAFSFDYKVSTSAVGVLDGTEGGTAMLGLTYGFLDGGMNPLAVSLSPVSGGGVVPEPKTWGLVAIFGCWVLWRKKHPGKMGVLSII